MDLDLPDAPAPSRAQPFTIRCGWSGPHGSQMRRQDLDNSSNALQRCSGKVSGKGGAPELLDMKPITLASKVKALGIV